MNEYLVFLLTGKRITIHADSEDEAREKAIRREVESSVSTVVCLEV